MLLGVSKVNQFPKLDDLYQYIHQNLVINKLLNFAGSALSDDKNYDEACHGSPNPTKWDPPLVFDLNIDPGERYSISPNTEKYK